MKTLLLYNPLAGRNRHKRKLLIYRAAACLNENGFTVTVEPTRAAGSGGAQAREAVEHGYQAVIACGGDGTIHDVLQGVAGTEALFGILPFGSANALARELRLDRDAVKTASLLRPSTTISVQAGVLRRAEETDRYFLSMAGAGPDGALMNRMLTVNRNRFGRLSYYTHAARLFLSQRFRSFEVAYSSPDGQKVMQTAVAAMVLRIGSLGGVFSGIARGASLHSPDMLLLLVHPPAWLSLPLWFVSSWTRSTKLNPLLTLAHVSRVTTGPSNMAKVYMQADGECLGRGSCEIAMQGIHLRLLVPDIVAPGDPPRSGGGSLVSDQNGAEA